MCLSVRDKIDRTAATWMSGCFLRKETLQTHERYWQKLAFCLSMLFRHNYRVSKKTHFQNAVGATVHWLNYKKPAPLVSGNRFFGRFLLRLSRIKPSQVMYMVNLGPTVLNFGYDFFLLVPFFGTPCIDGN